MRLLRALRRLLPTSHPSVRSWSILTELREASPRCSREDGDWFGTRAACRQYTTPAFSRTRAHCGDKRFRNPFHTHQVRAGIHLATYVLTGLFTLPPA